MDNRSGYYQDGARSRESVAGAPPPMSAQDYAAAMDMSMNYGMQQGPPYDDFQQPQPQPQPRDKQQDVRKGASVYGAHLQGPMHMDQYDSRRLSMMAFAEQPDVDLDGFQYNPAQGASNPSSAGLAYPQPAADLRSDRLAHPDLALNTQFANQNYPYATSQAQTSAYSSAMHPSVSLDMEMGSAYPHALSMPLDLNDSSLAMMGGGLNMFAQNQFAQSMINSSINHDFMNHMPTPLSERRPSGMPSVDAFGNPALSAPRDAGSRLSSRTNSQEHISSGSLSRPPSEQLPTPNSLQSQRSGPQASHHDVPTAQFAQMKFPWPTPPGGFPTTMNQNPHTMTQFKNAYSSSGFDMFGILKRLATRPNPNIDLGAVDMSCAFVVCDAQAEDLPIVYCSESFEHLTGYTKNMILHRNCRFLQAPNGIVEQGEERNFCNHDSIIYLKAMLNVMQESQVSLLNYRRGGQSFLNMLTMIPIAWEEGGPARYIVGLQVDLVQQPGAVVNTNPDGSFRVDYRRDISLQSYIVNEGHKLQPEMGQTISKDEVSSVLASYGSSGDTEISRHIWDKILLENTDDVIHVLSLKGLFLYLSPSSNKVLEYDPSELVGTSLSSVCHPSDIVPVTRELKETTNNTSVNIVFRIRRKNSGYMWFEGHGSLHTEQGKGRKCIILVGRKRPVYTLSKTIVGASGGIGDNELWSKMSTSGMFLFVSGNVRQLLDKQPDELVGTGIQGNMRPESKQNFARALDIARTGRKAEVKHEMQNRRGQVLQAFTTIYPGDAVEGQKPTFVVAQTRLLKYSRSAPGQRPSIYTKERISSESRGSAKSDASSAHQEPTTHAGGTPLSTDDTTVIEQTGLPIGHQDISLASADNIFDELKTTRSSSWQYELRQMEKRNRYLAEEVQSLLAAKKKRKRRKGAGQLQKDCANCHTKTTPEWRRGPSGARDLCNSCGLRWAKQIGRVSPRNSSQASQGDKGKKDTASPRHVQQPILPLPSTTTIPDSAGVPGEKRTPQQISAGNHAAKVARMEAMTPHGYGGGIPSRIEEAHEPTD